MMTEAELAAAAERLYNIRNIRELLKRARHTLAMVNQHGKVGNVWKPTLQLRKPERYDSDNGISIEVEIPFGVIQQQAVYTVAKLERMIIHAGGTP